MQRPATSALVFLLLATSLPILLLSHCVSQLLCTAPAEAPSSPKPRETHLARIRSQLPHLDSDEIALDPFAGQYEYVRDHPSSQPERRPLIEWIHRFGGDVSIFDGQLDTFEDDYDLCPVPFRIRLPGGRRIEREEERFSRVPRGIAGANVTEALLAQSFDSDSLPQKTTSRSSCTP